jgi:hypothetical protein
MATEPYRNRMIGENSPAVRDNQARKPVATTNNTFFMLALLSTLDLYDSTEGPKGYYYSKARHNENTELPYDHE